MKCWVCHRQARGFGHTDTRHGVADPRHYPMDWAFCSRRCQEVFNVMYGNWQRVHEDRREGRTNLKEIKLVDPSDVELAAMRKCLKAFGAAADEIGFDKPLGTYSEEQALQVIDAIVTCFTGAMVEHHEERKFPPVRGLPAAADPLTSAFADMPDDLPWEEKR